MFNITNRQENASQNHKEMSLHIRYGSSYQKKQKTSVWQGCGETGNMRIAGGNGKCAASMENSMEVPQKVHHRIMYPEIPLLSI